MFVTMQSYINLVIIFILLPVSFCRDIERELTIEIKPGQTECFYQDVKAGEALEIEYQVIDGGQGELDINFHVFDLHGNTLIQDYKKADGAHKTTMSQDGDYRICWDNKFSRFNTKTVFFAILIDSDIDDDEDDDGDIENLGSPYRPEDIYEMKVEDIKDALSKIKGFLVRSRSIQDQIRAHEARDRNTAENNYSRVNTMSFVNVMVMMVTGLIQVVLLRSLFDEKSRLHRIWKKPSSSLYS